MTKNEGEPKTRPWKVRGFDTFDYTDWHHGSYETEEAAISVAKSKGGQMLQYCVYDPDGSVVFTSGTF